ncbi:sorting nexin-24-like [Macrosteles quadrilineatus]|uniref:sorting nexin-24-like n=1 Tax=Macrosteles quadrilineatus TaxID=74068 RepID=UPI0023E1F00B|nr:sorting nexin-24-like [Macrosteles quadrilineatus]
MQGCPRAPVTGKRGSSKTNIMVLISTTTILACLRKHFTTPAFPPKRVRCSQPKVLEQRRQGLEHYLQTMMKFGPSRAKIMNFLGVPDDGNRSEAANTVSHRPVFRVYLNSCLHPSHNKLPDIITEGVLSALYTH